MEKLYIASLLVSTYRTLNKGESVAKVSSLGNKSEVLDLSLEGIKNAVENGHTIIPSEMDNGTKKENWVSSQLVFLDIDETKLKRDDFIEAVMAIGLKPFMIYETMSSSLETPKYRVAYYLSQVIDDLVDYEALIRGFRIKYYQVGIIVDSQCLNANRIFFPSKEVIYFDESVIDAELITPIYEEVKVEDEVKTEGFITDNPIVEALANGDVGTVRELTNIILPDNFDELEFYGKLNAVKISEFFNLPVGRNFSDFFTEDSNPSSSIFKAKYSELYKSFNTGKTYSLVELVGKICDVTAFEALQIIESVIGKSFSSGYQLKMRQAIMHQKSHVMREIKKHEELHNHMKIGNLISFYFLLLDIAFDKVTDIPLNGENNLTFFASRDHIIELNREFFKVIGANSPRAVTDKINQLASLGLLQKESDISNKHISDKASKYQKAKGYRYRVNFISINLKADALVEANNIVKKTSKKGSRKPKSSLGMLSVHGKKKTEEVFSQSNIDKIIEAYDKQVALCEPIFAELIDKHGYCSDALVKQYLMDKGMTDNKSSQILVNMRQHFIEKYDFVTLTNAIIEEKKLVGCKARNKVFLVKN